MLRLRGILLVLTIAVASTAAQESGPATARADRELARYFEAETTKLEAACLTQLTTAEDWFDQRDELRQQLKEMLGLDPMPERTDLEVQVTAVTEHEDFLVRRLHYQSRPGLYVTGNLYVPRDVQEPLPAILYVCGHGRVKIDGVSYGNKVHYQHHPAWFARNGYVCLSIDTLQLGEIEGLHHGTYREGMWWWLNRGYTPAGVEAWNCVRAIDLLQSMPEVDGERIGVTGRSGGGAYSWWIAAIDERIKCAVPVAGITDLRNHVVDGCVEGHCDCMFMVNTYRWDYPMLAALVAPRPLLMSNTDSDRIFPLDGVYRTHQKVKRVYELLGAGKNVALHITAGPHSDTQELRVHAFRWMNQHLKGDVDSAIQPAEKFFEPSELKVFDSLPTDEHNTRIQEEFVPTGDPPLPENAEAWDARRVTWMRMLRQNAFRGWPSQDVPLEVATVNNADSREVEFTSQEHVRLKMWIAQGAGEAKSVELRLLAEEDWPVWQQKPDRFRAKPNTIVAWFAPRGIGENAWNPDARKQTQIRRRFYLLGQSLEGMRVYDVRRAVDLLGTHRLTRDLPLSISGSGAMGGIGLYASLFEPSVSRLSLNDFPESHRNGPILLNVRKHFDLPQALAMANAEVKLLGKQPDITFARHVAQLMGSPERVVKE